MEARALADTADLVALPPLLGEYRRRRPHDTALYQVVIENHRTFVSLREEEGRPVPAFVQKEFEKSPGQIVRNPAGNFIFSEQDNQILDMVTPAGARTVLFTFAAGTRPLGLSL